jgi:hypothetical protein
LLFCIPWIPNGLHWDWTWVSTERWLRIVQSHRWSHIRSQTWICNTRQHDNDRPNRNTTVRLPILLFHKSWKAKPTKKEIKKERQAQTVAFKFTTPTCMPTPAAEYSSCNWSRQPYFAITKTVVRCPFERQVPLRFLRSSGLIPRPQVASALPPDTRANQLTFMSLSSSLQPEGTFIRKQ